MEAHTAIQKGYYYSLSEQNLVDCVRGISRGCNGGAPSEAFEYVQRNGIERGAHYPYTARTGYCRYKSQTFLS